jgi:hypothetical protein
MHKVEDRALVTPKLLRRFELEANGPAFWALMQNREGTFLSHGHGPEPDALQQQVAKDLIGCLNKKLNHDGAWVWVYCDPPKAPVLAISVDPGVWYDRFVIMWMDRDGDVQFPIEFSRPFPEYIMEGPDPMIEACEAGWSMWKLHMRDILAPTEDQMSKSALLSTVGASVLPAVRVLH